MRNAIRFTVLCLVAATQLMAQVNLNVTSVTALNYPLVSVKFTATNASGDHYRTYSPGDFVIVEDGITRPVVSVSCPEPVTPPISVTLMFDISPSMLVADRLKNAKDAATEFVKLMDFPPARMGITVFYDESAIWEPYTTDKARVLQRISDIYSFGATTDVHGGFVDPTTGSIDFTKGEPATRYIIIFTDDYHTLPQQWQSEIFNSAISNNIKVFTVCMDAYNISPTLRNIAIRTGGQWFEKVTTPQQAHDILTAIGAQIYQYPDCELVYRTDGCDPTRNVNITLTKNGRSDTENRTFTIPATSIVTLEATPSVVDFGVVPKGITKTMDVTLRALNGDVLVEGIEQNPLGFRIVDNGGSLPPFTLAKGATRKITIEYRSTDTNRISAWLKVLCNAPCEYHITVTAGYTDDNQLALEHPIGGEAFYVGDVLTYRYGGIPTNEEVAIDYSTNGGKAWNTVSTSVYNYYRNWITADTPSDSCVAQVFTRTTRNNPQDSSWLPLQPSAFTSLDYGAVNAILAAGLSDGRVKLYNPYKGTLARIIQAHSGGVNKVAFSPDGKWFATSGNDRRIKVWNSSDGTPVFASAPFGNNTFGVAFSDDGQYLAGSDFTNVALWRTSDWSVMWNVPNQATSNGAVAVDPKHRWVASAYGSAIAILDFRNGARIRTLNDHTGNVHALAVSEDGWILASGSSDNSVRIWNTYVWEQSLALQGHTAAINDLALSPGGMQVASASDDKTVRVWDTKKGTQLHLFTGHTANVNGVAMGKRFGMIASGGDDKRLRMWTYSPSMADRSDSTWRIIPKITDIVATTPEFDVLLCPQDFSEKKVTIYNRGNQPIQISDLHIAGDDSAHFSIVAGPAIPPDYTLPPEDSLVLTIRFQADARGLYNGVLEVITAGNSLPIVSVQLSGRKEEAVFAVDPASIDFGEVYHCTVPTTRTTVLTNTGTVPVRISLTSNTLTGAVRLLTQPRDTLQPGESDTLTVELNTLAQGTFSGKLTFTSLPCSYTRDIDVAYSFVNSAPVATPNPVVFDYTSVGNSSFKDLTIANPTKTTMHIAEARISGGVFALADPGAIPLSIGPNGFATLTLQFTPATEGPVSGQIMLVSDSPCNDTVYVPLQGSSAKKPAIAATVDPFARLVCKDEQYTQVNGVVRNTGGEDLVISEYRIAGSNPGDFIIVAPTSKPLTIAPNNDQPFTIGFRPTVPGDRTAELQLISNAENEDTLRVQLAARKDSVNFLIPTAPLALGERYHCQFPATYSIQFSNPGNIPVTIALDQTTLPSYATFPAGTFPMTIQPGATTTADITLAPKQYGTFTETLRFTEARCNTERTYGISFSFADSKPTASSLLLDFGLLNSGGSQQRSITINNATASPVVVGSIVSTGGNASITRLQPQAIPATISAGGAMTLEYEYAPLAADTLDQEIIIITSSPCVDTITVRLRGRSSSASSLVSLPDLSGKIGSTVRIPLRLEQSSNLTVAGATAFTADISFNASMLWVTGVESNLGTVQYNTRVQVPATSLHIDVASTVTPSNGILAEIVCIVALGDAEQTVLVIDSFTWKGSNAGVSTRDGGFTAEGICRAGGDRLVRLDDGIVLFQNAPNPFNPSTEIGYYLPEEQHVDLRVYNSLGKEVARLEYGRKPEGYHSAIFNAAGTSTGIYTAILRGERGAVRTIRMVMTK